MEQLYDFFRISIFIKRRIWFDFDMEPFDLSKIKLKRNDLNDNIFFEIGHKN